MQFTASGGGWVRCVTGDATVSVQVALAKDGRLVPWRVDITATKDPVALTEAHLRAIPLNEIEAAANGPELRDTLIERLDEKVKAGLSREIEGDGTEMRPARRRPTGKLPVPDGNRYPDGFYRRAAVEYTRLIASGDRSPARTIAEANEVPTTTAHRWIKEARHRGFLAPGRKGRAG